MSVVVLWVGEGGGGARHGQSKNEICSTRHLQEAVQTKTETGDVPCGRVAREMRTRVLRARATRGK